MGIEPCSMLIGPHAGTAVEDYNVNGLVYIFVPNGDNSPTAIKLASTDDPGVHTMGMIMLEPADIGAENISRTVCDTCVLVEKQLLVGSSDVGFFLAKAYDDLSALVRGQLKTLVSSQVQVVHHTLMAGPRIADKHDAIKTALLDMSATPKGMGVLESLDMTGWSEVGAEDSEFMIDLMDTLMS